ncbi:hypothetical protein KQI69_09225 [Eubacterium sp. MSJ-13]|uniref:DUF6120 family protein n=1 Tax=Eubacterium sp. MSJ-13 TaxID=2841513 RepID=UPI001C10867A|nr:DUF6120 family protein [Eubacterium sp. MSJ-13]MBU5479386.1 hypothetical protein [Eubacterium sp. MSJ-13]
MKTRKKLCKKYISQIRSFFPIITKKERKYLNNICDSVNEYCGDNPTATLNDLYDIFGSPQETINSYIITHTNFASYMKKIRLAKWIKRIAIVLIIAIIFISAVLFKNIQEEHETFENEKIGISEETIK